MKAATNLNIKYTSILKKLELRRDFLYTLNISNKIRQEIKRINNELSSFTYRNFTQGIGGFQRKQGINPMRAELRSIGKVGRLKLQGFSDVRRDCLPEFVSQHKKNNSY